MWLASIILIHVKSCFQSIKLATIPGLMEPKWEIFRANLASMNQIMPNSQETVLKITLTEALVLTGQQMLMHPLCPYYSR